MPGERPVKVGLYELLQDFETAEASIRVIRMERGTKAVERHVHHRSTQIYVALQGRCRIERDGTIVETKPYEVVVIPPGTVHGAQSAAGEAVFMNISMPPLAADDQVPVARMEPAAIWDG